MKVRRGFAIERGNTSSLSSHINVLICTHLGRISLSGLLYIYICNLSVTATSVVTAMTRTCTRTHTSNGYYPSVCQNVIMCVLGKLEKEVNTEVKFL